METSQNNLLGKNNKKIRDSLSVQDRQFLSQQIVISLKALLESDFKRANIFLCYYPFGSEVDILPLYKELINNGKKLYFPVSQKATHEMVFRQVNNLSSDFHPGAYGIMEPNDTLEKYTFKENTFVFTPGLVFDTKCNRLGYGAGYYDRMFNKYPHLIKVGIGFDSLINEKIVPGIHDVPMDYIVTDKRIIRRDSYDND